ncbi:MAG: formimidoylglutamase [Gammaproteobacteria bacterium]
MAWTSYYLPPTSKLWQGRSDTPDRSAFFKVIELLDLNQPINHHLPSDRNQHIQNAFAFLGFSCDEGVKRNLGRPGAIEGPAAIRTALAKLPVHINNFICYDAGDITCTNGNLEEAQAALAEATAMLLRNSITPIVLGGGHELAWGHYQGIHQAFPNDDVSIVNFDAHFDMRPIGSDGKGTSGTPFSQISNLLAQEDRPFYYNCIGVQATGNTNALFDIAEEQHVNFLMAEDVMQNDQKKCEAFINRIIFYKKFIYLSLCMDVFGAAFSPGVSAPQALGITPWQMLPYIKMLAASGKILSYDIAELLPEKDIDDRTAKLAATFIYEMIHHHVSPY